VEIFLVGGAVRDALLGLPVRERDWVVVGSTPTEMQRLGYRQVGRDFPVFLHPQTSEEYALARTERKVASGHTGFVCHAGPDVTLEEDLRRRDLTVNAIAQAPDGALIDPFGGTSDIAARCLRHVSDAFVEDPLRVFRVARFAAQLGAFEFRVAVETQALLHDMCRQDLVAELAPERIWQELHKALDAAAPGAFFEVLRACEGLGRWFSELAPLSGLSEFIDQRAATLPGALARYGTLGWLLDVEAVASLSQRLKAPTEFGRAAADVARHGRVLVGWRSTGATELLAALKATGALRQPDWFQREIAVLSACVDADLSALERLARDVAAVPSEPLRQLGHAGRDLGVALDEVRLQRIRDAQGLSATG
jgi:tRNA nucleotidyltransferase (CCA-adding enzyme)